jgi:hypothetical protein
VTRLVSEDRAPDGEWCWCPYVPAGQDPHDCADHHPARSHDYDGAHIHPIDITAPISVLARDQIARAIEAAAGLDDPADLTEYEADEIELDEEQQYARQHADIVRAWPVPASTEAANELVRLVCEVTGRPDAAAALRWVLEQPAGGPSCGCGGNHWVCTEADHGPRYCSQGIRNCPLGHGEG